MKRASITLMAAAFLILPAMAHAQISSTWSYSFPRNTVYANTQLTGLGNAGINFPWYHVTLGIEKVLMRCANKPGNSYLANGQPFQIDFQLTGDQTGDTLVVRNGRALSTIEFPSEVLVQKAIEAYKAVYGADAEPCKKNWYVVDVIVTQDNLHGQLFSCTDSTYTQCQPWDELRVDANLLSPFPASDPGALPPPDADTCSTNDQAMSSLCNYYLDVTCSDSRKVFNGLAAKPSCDQVPYCNPSCTCTSGSGQPCNY